MIDGLIAVPEVAWERTQAELKAVAVIYAQEQSYRNGIMQLIADLQDPLKWVNSCQFFSADDMRLAMIDALKQIMEARPQSERQGDCDPGGREKAEATMTLQRAGRELAWMAAMLLGLAYP